MTPVFLDTVGLVAVWDRTDQWHALAVPVFLRLLATGRPLASTSLVMYECGNAAARRTYRADVDDFRNWLIGQGCLVEPTPADVANAWTAYRAGGLRSPGIVDHISFLVMRRLGLTDAFTNDRYFRAAGLVPLF